MNTQSNSQQVPDHTEMTTREHALGRKFVRATFGLHKLGNQCAYWSLTGEVYEAHGTWSGAAQFRNGREPDMGGQVHEYILKAMPKLAPFAALHLSDVNGVPMHAVANGAYFLAQGEAEKAAELWRCSVDDIDVSMGVEAFVDAQRDRWQAESVAAYELLQTL